MKLYVGIAIGLVIGVCALVLVPSTQALLVPSGNGDVNSDGVIDNLDVVFLARCVHVPGAPAPVPIVCPPCPECPPNRLPATGQTKCFDSAGVEIPCDSAEYPGQDGYYQAGCPMAGRFVDNGDGTITDACTGLMWQELALPGPEYEPSIHAEITWQNALKYCDDLVLAGHDDWRLPNVNELWSLLDFANSQVVGFGFGSVYYWSSTSALVESEARVVYYQSGIRYLESPKTEKMRLRAVRGGL